MAVQSYMETNLADIYIMDLVHLRQYTVSGDLRGFVKISLHHAACHTVTTEVLSEIIESIGDIVLPLD